MIILTPLEITLINLINRLITCDISSIFECRILCNTKVRDHLIYKYDLDYCKVTKNSCSWRLKNIKKLYKYKDLQ